MIYTHEYIDLVNGVLAKPGVLWGNNALQSITIARQTPRTPQQAVGYLGIVDYTRGVVISDLTLDTMLTEECDKAFPNGGAVPSGNSFGDARSLYSYAPQQINVGVEEYILTSIAVAFQSGAPATANYGFLTAGLASALAILSQQPHPRTGAEDPFAVVMGDDGTGVSIECSGGTMEGSTQGLVSYIDPQDGTMKTEGDGGLPGGVQSLSFSGRINRDNVLDVRSVTPVQFVTLYPIDASMDMTIHQLPTDGTLDKMDYLAVKGAGHTFTPPGTRDPNNSVGHTDEYVRAVGAQSTQNQSTISVGRYLSYTYTFTLADLWIPIGAVPTF